MCRDLNADGVVDDLDYTRHLAHCCDHAFPGDPCDWLSQDIELDPDGGFAVGDSIEIHRLLENNPNGGTCQVDSVVMYEGEWKLNTIWDRVDVMVRGVSGGAGGQDSDSPIYEVPDFGKMCLRAVLYSDCCATPQVENVCTDVIRQCPPDAFCFEFRTLSLAVADETIVRHDLPLGLGWTFDITTSGETTITLICTSDFTPVGATGTLPRYFGLVRRGITSHTGWHRSISRVICVVRRTICRTVRLIRWTSRA